MSSRHGNGTSQFFLSVCQRCLHRGNTRYRAYYRIEFLPLSVFASICRQSTDTVQCTHTQLNQNRFFSSLVLSLLHCIYVECSRLCVATKCKVSQENSKWIYEIGIRIGISVINLLFCIHTVEICVLCRWLTSVDIIVFLDASSLYLRESVCAYVVPFLFDMLFLDDANQ